MTLLKILNYFTNQYLFLGVIQGLHNENKMKNEKIMKTK
jgi:hypothetical protein